MAEGVKAMLTETAFVIPGTKVAVPRWAVLGTAAALIVILLLVKRSGETAAAGEESDEEEASGGGVEDWIDEMIEEMQPAEDIVDGLGPIGELPDWTYTEGTTPTESASLGGIKNLDAKIPPALKDTAAPKYAGLKTVVVQGVPLPGVTIPFVSGGSPSGPAAQTAKVIVKAPASAPKVVAK